MGEKGEQIEPNVGAEQPEAQLIDEETKRRLAETASSVAIHGNTNWGMPTDELRDILTTS